MNDERLIKIIHEPCAAEPFVVLQKPAGLASAPLHSAQEESAFSQAARLFPKIKSVVGKKPVEGGLLHRIDSGTAGLLLIAESQEFYEHMARAQAQGRFVKEYQAECDVFPQNAALLEGFPTAAPFLRQKIPGGIEKNERTPPQGAGACGLRPNEQTLAFFNGLEIASAFRHYGQKRAAVRPVVLGSGRAAQKKVQSKKIYCTKILSVKALEKRAGEGGFCARVSCRLLQGFKHQARSHLAWAGLPIIGDRLYNFLEQARSGQRIEQAFAQEAGQKTQEARMRFFASSLSFPDLHSEKIFSFSLPPDF